MIQVEHGVQILFQSVTRAVRSKRQIKTNIRLRFKTSILHLITHPFSCFYQVMCGLLQCGPVFDPNGLITGGYLYNWLQTVLNSPKEKVSFVRTFLENKLSFKLLFLHCISLCLLVYGMYFYRTHKSYCGQRTLLYSRNNLSLCCTLGLGQRVEKRRGDQGEGAPLASPLAFFSRAILRANRHFTGQDRQDPCEARQSIKEQVLSLANLDRSS